MLNSSFVNKTHGFLLFPDYYVGSNFLLFQFQILTKDFEKPLSKSSFVVTRPQDSPAQSLAWEHPGSRQCPPKISPQALGGDLAVSHNWN